MHSNEWVYLVVMLLVGTGVVLIVVHVPTLSFVPFVLAGLLLLVAVRLRRGVYRKHDDSNGR